MTNWVTSFVWTALVGSALALSAAKPVTAQMMAPSQGGGGTGFNDQGPEAATTFLGLEVQARRLIADPNTKGFKVVIGLKDTDQAARLAALMAPAPTMLDDMGNVYHVTAVSGAVRVCSGFKYSKATDCAYRDRPSFVRLPSGLEVAFIMTFAPTEGQVLAETLPLAQTASLQARVALIEDGAKYTAAKSNDLVINGLALPK
ncbi:MAG: hypothetical protein AAF713_05960 [Pseudomonadota bacterium]